MSPDSYNFYDLLVDVVIPIGTFIVGLLVERKWHIVGNLFKFHDESKVEQSQIADGDIAKPYKLEISTDP